MRNLRTLAAVLAYCLMIPISHGSPVEGYGGWVADFSPEVEHSNGAKTVGFTLEGSYRLTGGSIGELHLLLFCVGMETTTSVGGGASTTQGTGRCVLKGKDGVALHAAIDTGAQGFVLKVDGGTGRLANLRGSVTSHETFTAETPRQLKGFSSMKGELSNSP